MTRKSDRAPAKPNDSEAARLLRAVCAEHGVNEVMRRIGAQPGMVSHWANADVKPGRLWSNRIAQVFPQIAADLWDVEPRRKATGTEGG